MSNFNTAALRDLLKAIPEVKEEPRFLVCNPECYTVMRELLDREIKLMDTLTAFRTDFGINLWQKPDQVRRCWAFSNIQTAMAYLQGDITEAQIAALAGEGFGA